MNKIIYLGVLCFFSMYTQIAYSGDSAGNGGIDGVYDVETTELIHEEEIEELLSLSQVPLTIKDPLGNEILNSPYLKADKDVKHEGRRFPGDWIIGDDDKLFYARTIPKFGGATTFFPVFYTLPKEKQIKFIIHEAIHRLEFLSPNNMSEDFVVATVNRILSDVEVVRTGDRVAKAKSKSALLAWFESVGSRGNVPWEKMHWVGHVNLYFDRDFTRPYGNQLISFYPNKVKNKWYVERSLFSLSWPHVPKDQWRIYDVSGPVVGGQGPKEFVKTLRFKVKFKDYYFVGTAKSLLDPIEGKIYESDTDLYAGQFRLNPYHDGGTGVGYMKFPFNCGPGSTLPLPNNCFGSGAGTGTGTGTGNSSGTGSGNGYLSQWPFQN